MEKTFKINVGKAMLLNDSSEAFAGYDSVMINSGKVVASKKAYEKLLSMGVSINSGNVEVLDITGEIAELGENTTITESMSYDGCFIVCDGNLVIESVKGLKNITGLYAEKLFHPESVDLSEVRNITASDRIVYPDGAKLSFREMVLGGDSHVILEDNTRYWVHGSIKALDEDALAHMRRKNTSFHCRRLLIYTGLYEKYRDIFKADRYTFVPDGYAVVDDISLDAATSLLYGDKLFINGDLMVAHDQASHLKGFKALTVNGTVTMPVSAAADFKAVGKANDFSLYEGALLSINGFQTLGHGQLQSAISEGISYTVKVNGSLYFTGDVTAQDMEAIAAVYCNGLISAPDSARGALDSKVKELNGTIVDIDAMMKKMYGEDFSVSEDPIGFLKKLMSQMNGGGENDGAINAGTFKL